MEPTLNIAVRAARAASSVIQRNVERVADLKIDTKSVNDFVTDVDRQAEQAIIATIQESYPDHAFLAEESGVTGDNENVWIIDPLDGTTNFLHSFPQYAISIALQQKGVLTQAVIYDPTRNEMFTASRGGGALMNNQKMRVTQRRTLEGSLIGTGFPFKEQERLELFLDTFRALFPMTAGIRRPGSAALDLAYVACGRLDGFWEFGLCPWDMAAGVLLIQEAGGAVSDMIGREDYLHSGDIIAGNTYVQTEIHKVFRSVLKQHEYRPPKAKIVSTPAA